MLKVRVSPSGSEAEGVNAYELPIVTVAGGVPEIVGGLLTGGGLGGGGAGGTCTGESLPDPEHAASNKLAMTAK